MMILKDIRFYETNARGITEQWNVSSNHVQEAFISKRFRARFLSRKGNFSEKLTFEQDSQNSDDDD